MKVVTKISPNPRETEATLLKMFGLQDAFILSMTITCTPDSYPVAVANLYPVEISQEETINLDDMVGAAKHRLAKFISGNFKKLSLEVSKSFDEIQHNVNWECYGHARVTSYTLEKLKTVSKHVLDSSSCRYYGSYVFGTPPSTDGSYKTTQKNF